MQFTVWLIVCFLLWIAMLTQGLKIARPRNNVEAVLILSAAAFVPALWLFSLYSGFPKCTRLPGGGDFFILLTIYGLGLLAALHVLQIAAVSGVRLWLAGYAALSIVAYLVSGFPLLIIVGCAAVP
jgi:hypothetical protein